MSLPKTMKAVVLLSPLKVSIEDRPTPTIQDQGDAIIRVHLAGLCGSDLHTYRGIDIGEDHEPFIMGHEAVGEIVALGSQVREFSVGDMVISPFSLSCGNCFYCDKGYSARCERQILLGSPKMPGAQAEYLRIAMADASLFHSPEGIKKELGLMMCDILPTGYSVAMNAWRLADEDREMGGGGGLAGEGKGKGKGKKGICVVIGCGPVGLCAITSATTMFEKVFATDLALHRLAAAEKHGAIALPKAELLVALSEATDGRGADAVLELVGHEGALITAIELARPYGVISVGGVHHAPLSLNGGILYDKNLRFQFGRCSVRSFFNPALQVLRANHELFDGFVEHVVGWHQAEEYYALFERNKVGKTAFMAYDG